MTKAQHTTRRRVDSLDDESKNMIYSGVNISQLAKLFGLDNRTIAEKINDVPASGSRNGTETWKVRDVAPHLVKPVLGMEDYLRNMNPNELPKTLSKEFWTAQKVMLDVKEREGDLWATERVIKAIGGIFKTVKIATKMMNDQVDTQAELTTAQRRAIRQLNDSLLRQIHADIVELFAPETGATNPGVQESAETMLHEVENEEDEEL